MTEYFCNLSMQIRNPNSMTLLEYYNTIKNLNHPNIIKIKYSETIEGQVESKIHPQERIPPFFYCFQCQQYTDDETKECYHLETCQGVDDLFLTNKGIEHYSKRINEMQLNADEPLLYTQLFPTNNSRKIPNKFALPKLVRNAIQLIYKHNDKKITCVFSLTKKSCSLSMVDYNDKEVIISNIQNIFKGVVFENVRLTYMSCYVNIIKEEHTLIDDDCFQKHTDHLKENDIKFQLRSVKGTVFMWSNTIFDINIFKNMEFTLKTQVDTNKCFYTIVKDKQERYWCKKKDQKANPRRCVNSKEKSKNPDIKTPVPFSFYGKPPCRYRVITERYLPEENEYEPCSEVIRVNARDRKKINILGTTPYDSYQSLISLSKTHKKIETINPKNINGAVANKIVRRLLHGYPNNEYEQDKPTENGFKISPDGKILDPLNKICYYDEHLNYVNENRSYPGLINVLNSEYRMAFLEEYLDRFQKQAKSEFENITFYFKITKDEKEEIILLFPGTYKKVTGIPNPLFISKSDWTSVKSTKVYPFILNYYINRYNEYRLFKYKPLLLKSTNIVTNKTTTEEEWNTFKAQHYDELFAELIN